MRALVAATLLLPATALAQATVNVPQVLGYQGRLLKADGSPVTGPENPGQVNIIFRIYDQPVEGTLKWTEKQTVLLRNGFYAVFLGSEDSKKPNDEPKLFDALGGHPRWLELQIEGDSMPLTPRQQIGSVAYAFRSAHAASADTAANVSGGGTVTATGGTFTGPVTVPTPTKPEHAATRGYVDGKAFARSNLPAVGQQTSSSCGFWSTGSQTLTDVANLSVTLTTTGRPVILILQSDNGGYDANISMSGAAAVIAFARDGTTIGHWAFSAGYSAQTIIPASLLAIDTQAGAGTHTWKVRAATGNPNTSVYISSAALVAFEL